MAADPDRLNGWKEIATFLDKGVRTVQRWERDYRLPIHRVGPDGEIIFAYRSEIEAWIRAREKPTANPPPAARPPAALPRPAPRRVRVDAVAVASLVMVVTLTLIGMWLERAASRPADALTWRVVGNVLDVRNAAGTTLWSHRFPGNIPANAVEADHGRPRNQRLVILEDLDGEGTREVVVTYRPEGVREGNAVYVFNADGSLRFRYTPPVETSVTFGHGTYGGPWLAFRTFVVPDRDGSATIWATFIHGNQFPTMLVELDPRNGLARGTYWSNGYVEYVTLASWRGVPSVLVGGTNNETRGASLAVFRRGGVAGSAPAVDLRYRCLSCPPGGPDAFLVFPRHCVGESVDGQALVQEVWRDEQDRLHVHVVEGDADARGVYTAGAWYDIGPKPTVVDAELTTGFMRVHQDLERAGRVTHDVERDRSVSWDVRHWRDGAFVATPGHRPPPSAHTQRAGNLAPLDVTPRHGAR